MFSDDFDKQLRGEQLRGSLVRLFFHHGQKSGKEHSDISQHVYNIFIIHKIHPSEDNDFQV